MAAAETNNDPSMHQYTATYVGRMRLNPKYKLVISIDLGTTYSGTAIVTRNDPTAVNCGAPGAQNTRDETKTPTVLLRCPDPEGSPRWIFGKDAEEIYKELLAESQQELVECESVTEALMRRGIALFRNYKMELNNRSGGDAASLVAKSTTGQPHSLLELMSKSLEFLSEYALRQVKDGWMGALDVTRDEILWVLTVPAIWSDFGKAFMRQAAFNAGLISDISSDQLLLALEPESASIAVHAEGKKNDLFSQGTSFCIVDIGGGTVDITVHRVVADEPLTLDEVAAPTGGPWGGIYVDKQFEIFLHRLIGRDRFQQLQRTHSADIADVMDEFRVEKENFDPGNRDRMTEINIGGLFSDGIADQLGIPSLLELVQQYNSRTDTKVPFDLSRARTLKQIGERDKLTFSRDQMLEFFEPTLNEICNCVRNLLHQHQDVSIVTVVGGYGSSKVLKDRITTEFEGAPFNKTVLKPDASLRPQAAIMTGGAYYGLYTSVIGRRITRFTYGIRTSQKWHEGCRFSKDDAIWDEEKRELRVKDVFYTIVRTDTSVGPFQRFDANNFSPVYEDQTSCEFPVYKSNSWNPQRVTDSSCERIGSVSIPCKYTDSFEVKFTFADEIRVEVIRQDGVVRSTRVTID